MQILHLAGESVYGEKRVSVEVPVVDGESKKIEYRIWNPFRSKLAASILAGIDNIHIKPGAKVLYLGAASGTSVSHVSDIVGPEGSVFAVEFSHRSGEKFCFVKIMAFFISYMYLINDFFYLCLWRSMFTSLGLVEEEITNSLDIGRTKQGPDMCRLHHMLAPTFCCSQEILFGEVFAYQSDIMS